MSASLAHRYGRLSTEDREAYREQAEVSYDALLDDWRFWARPEQLAPPGDWLIWFVQAGRRFGKTRCASEWIRERIEDQPPWRTPMPGQPLGEHRCLRSSSSPMTEG